MKATADQYQSKADEIRPLLIKENNLYKAGKMQGMIDAFEYCSEDLINRYPAWTVWVKDVLLIFISLGLGFVIGYGIYAHSSSVPCPACPHKDSVICRQNSVIAKYNQDTLTNTNFEMR